MTGTDAAAAKRFSAGADAARGRISQRRAEIDAALELARQRGEALASREALCQRVETIEGDDILEQLVPIEEEWAQLTPLVGNGPEADQLAARFAQAVGACRKRHALGTTLQQTHASLDALVVEAEALPAQGEEAAAARWQALSRDARALIATLNDASRPASDLADRLAV
jgi:macrodomain Ter protein organizer (MatP/YcbG family)